MQLLCNGIELELPSGTGMSFQKLNPLFAFSKLQCERTQSFKVPATAHNEQVFNLAKLPAYDGQSMRVKFAAEFRDGYVSKQGYLYVDTYENGAYNCIFVTGDLVGLQAIKNLGKLKDIMYSDKAIRVGGLPMPPGLVTSIAWQNANYKHASGIVFPSALVRYICDEVIRQNNLSAISFPAITDGLRIITNEPKLPDGDTGDLASEITGSTTSIISQAVPINTLSILRAGDGLWKLNDASDIPTFEWHYQLGYDSIVYEYFKMYGFKALADLAIKFPEDWDDNIFVCAYRSGVRVVSEITNLDFLGERYFEKNQDASPVVYGASLKGRSVEVPYGTQILFVTPDMFDNYTISQGGQTRVVHGWNMVDIAVTDLEVSGDVASEGQISRLYDNLPDMTFVELLQVIANLSGTMLNYTDAAGITFDPLDIPNWSTIDITGRVIAEKKLARRFGDYKQHNIVQFKSEHYVDSRLVTDYAIANDNLEAENILQTIPFSEGASSIDGQYNIIYIRTRDGQTDDAMSIANGDTMAQYMERVTLTKNANLQSLCDASTEIEVAMDCPLPIFEELQAQKVILYRGTRYVWTEAQWSKGVVTIQLSKIIA